VSEIVQFHGGWYAAISYHQKQDRYHWRLYAPGDAHFYRDCGEAFTLSEARRAAERCWSKLSC
jgi:hypothetical protein